MTELFVQSMQPNAAPEELLARYVAGDDAAFALLVQAYEVRLFSFLARMVNDSHIAEDVFQQVFIKVAKHASTFDGRASFSTWLYRIARNTALDELRRRKRRFEAVASVEFEYSRVADVDQEEPWERLSREELTHKVRQALQKIPQEQREAFLLKEEGGLDFNEIGITLGCGRETAKSRVRLAIGKLRQLLGVGNSPVGQRDGNG